MLTLSNQAVQVLVVGPLNAEVATADIVDSLVVNHKAAVGVLQGGVGGKNGVVRLNNGGGDLGGGVDTELELALLAVVHRQTLHEESTEAGTSATTERVEDEEALKTGAVVRHTPNFVQHLVDELLAHGVVTTGVVVGCILLARDHHLWVEEIAVGAGADLIDDVRLEVAVDCAWDILAVAYRDFESVLLRV